MVDKVVTTDMANIEGINNDTQYLAFQILNFFAFQNPGEFQKVLFQIILMPRLLSH